MMVHTLSDLDRMVVIFRNAGQQIKDGEYYLIHAFRKVNDGFLTNKL